MDSKTNKDVKVYFKNLNAIRFIAALLVIFHHVEQQKNFLHLPNDVTNYVINLIGKLGVILFFVLSGFLISYLLFKEHEITGKISVRKFYIRRILRIWPLYFLVIFISLAILPFIDLFTYDAFPKSAVWSYLILKIILFVFFLPNMVISVFGIVPYAAQTWSIGSEEQFYLVWPWLIKKIKNRWLAITGVIVFYLIVLLVLEMLSSNKFINLFKNFWVSTHIDCMAIGGLFALVVFEKSNVTAAAKKILFSKITQVITLALLIGLISSGYFFPFLNYEIYGIMFGIMIANFAANEKRLFSLENPVTNYLGKISYGLYMYHPVAITLSIKISLSLGTSSNYLVTPLATLLTVVIAGLSYRFYEKYFIDMKVKYSDIISGDNAKNAPAAKPGNELRA